MLRLCPGRHNALLDSEHASLQDISRGYATALHWAPCNNPSTPPCREGSSAETGCVHPTPRRIRRHAPLLQQCNLRLIELLWWTSMKATTQHNTRTHRQTDRQTAKRYSKGSTTVHLCVWGCHLNQAAQRTPGSSCPQPHAGSACKQPQRRSATCEHQGPATGRWHAAAAHLSAHWHCAACTQPKTRKVPAFLQPSHNCVRSSQSRQHVTLWLAMGPSKLLARHHKRAPRGQHLGSGVAEAPTDQSTAAQRHSQRICGSQTERDAQGMRRITVDCNCCTNRACSAHRGTDKDIQTAGAGNQAAAALGSKRMPLAASTGPSRV